MFSTTETKITKFVL